MQIRNQLIDELLIAIDGAREDQDKQLADALQGVLLAIARQLLKQQQAEPQIKVTVPAGPPRKPRGRPIQMPPPKDPGK